MVMFLWDPAHSKPSVSTMGPALLPRMGKIGAGAGGEGRRLDVGHSRAHLPESATGAGVLIPLGIEPNKEMGVARRAWGACQGSADVHRQV